MERINVESLTVDLDGAASDVDSIGVASDVLAQYVSAIVTGWLCEQAAAPVGERTEFRIMLAVNRCDL